MTTVNTFGTEDGSSLILQAGYPQLTATGRNGWRIEYKYRCNMESVRSLAPAWRSACPLAGLENHEATAIEITPIGMPGFCELTVVYTYPLGVSITKREDGEIVKSSNVTSSRIPIDDPGLLTLGYTQSDIDALRKAGYLAVNVSSVEYSYTQYLESFTWSESNITEDDNNVSVGKTGSPEGLSSPTSGKWMFVGRSIRDDGELVETTDVWKFNALGWK